MKKAVIVDMRGKGCYSSLEITLSRYVDQFSAQIILFFIYPNQPRGKKFDNFTSYFAHA